MILCFPLSELFSRGPRGFVNILFLPVWPPFGMGSYGECNHSSEMKRCYVFVLDSSELGATDLVQHVINTGDHPPKHQSEK